MNWIPFNYLQEWIWFYNIYSKIIDREMILDTINHFKTTDYFEIDLTNIKKPFDKTILKWIDFKILQEDKFHITIQLIIDNKKFNKQYN